jgi:hypothetical protein
MTVKTFCATLFALGLVLPLISCGSGSGSSDDSFTEDESAKSYVGTDTVFIRCTQAVLGSARPANIPCTLRLEFKVPGDEITREADFSCDSGIGRSCEIFRGSKADLINLYNSTNQEALSPEKTDFTNVSFTGLQSDAPDSSCIMPTPGDMTIKKSGNNVISAIANGRFRCATTPTPTPVPTPTQTATPVPVVTPTPTSTSWPRPGSCLTAADCGSNEHCEIPITPAATLIVLGVCKEGAGEVVFVRSW